MLRAADNLVQSVSALRVHKLRTVLTVIGLTMGVATLITVMTIVQGANVYVEQKIANLGTNVFQIARTPFAATDFDVVLRALKYKHIELDDLRAMQEACSRCEQVGASASTTASVRSADRELADVNIIGHTANMAGIDTRTVEQGRYFTEVEEQRASPVCLIGATISEQLFAGANPIGRSIRIQNEACTVVGAFEKIGSVLGQDSDNFVIIPLSSFFRLQGARFSLTLNVRASDAARYDEAMDQARMIMLSRRRVAPNGEENFFIGTKESYMSLWQSISGAFFVVFVMVSSISALVGGIVIMNVMLVSVTERTKEIGVRRALGATQADIRKQFLTESVMQCVVGGFVGITGGFVVAILLRNATSFPAAVRTWVAVLGVVLSSGIGLFFGLYPAIRASRLDPVVALRAE